MSLFYTNEAVSLEKLVDLKGDITTLSPTHIEELYDVSKCVEWIKRNSFQKVCLQFPDHLLPHSTDVALAIQNILKQTVYILGDTAYESCCIDYIAAAHVDADAIIHFGPVCFSKSSATVPYLNIYQKLPIDVASLKRGFQQKFVGSSEDVRIILDDGYIHSLDECCAEFDNNSNVKFLKIDEDLACLTDKNVIFVGTTERKVMNIYFSFKPKCLYTFNPTSTEILQWTVNSTVIKRRYFLKEKIRDAHTIGIVIGTLGVKNYLKVIERIKKLIQLSGKKYYMISVGKPTVAKLANLGEIDIYVMITCAMNEIYDSREFYKPVVTPYDVEMALNNADPSKDFVYDYNNYLDNEIESLDQIPLTEVSLLTGKLRSNLMENTVEVAQSQGLEIATKTDRILALNDHFGAGYLQERTWKGLEQNLGQSEVKLAEEGRVGIARGYDNEAN